MTDHSRFSFLREIESDKIIFDFDVILPNSEAQNSYRGLQNWPRKSLVFETKFAEGLKTTQRWFVQLTGPHDYFLLRVGWSDRESVEMWNAAQQINPQDPINKRLWRSFSISRNLATVGIGEGLNQSNFLGNSHVGATIVDSASKLESRSELDAPSSNYRFWIGTVPNGRYRPNTTHAFSFFVPGAFASVSIGQKVSVRDEAWSFQAPGNPPSNL